MQLLKGTDSFEKQLVHDIKSIQKKGKKNERNICRVFTTFLINFYFYFLEKLKIGQSCFLDTESLHVNKNCLVVIMSVSAIVASQSFSVPGGEKNNNNKEINRKIYLDHNLKKQSTDSNRKHLTVTAGPPYNA